MTRTKRDTAKQLEEYFIVNIFYACLDLNVYVGISIMILVQTIMHHSHCATAVGIMLPPDPPIISRGNDCLVPSELSYNYKNGKLCFRTKADITYTVIVIESNFCRVKNLFTDYLHHVHVFW